MFLLHFASVFYATHEILEKQRGVKINKYQGRYDSQDPQQPSEQKKKAPLRWKNKKRRTSVTQSHAHQSVFTSGPPRLTDSPKAKGYLAGSPSTFFPRTWRSCLGNFPASYSSRCSSCRLCPAQIQDAAKKSWKILNKKFNGKFNKMGKRKYNETRYFAMARGLDSKRMPLIHELPRKPFKNCWVNKFQITLKHCNYFLDCCVVTRFNNI